MKNMRNWEAVISLLLASSICKTVFVSYSASLNELADLITGYI